MSCCKLVKKENSEVVFTVEIPANEFERAVFRAYRKESQGKKEDEIPPLMSFKAFINDYPAAEKVVTAAVQELFPPYYAQAIKELDLEPLTFPRIAPLQAEIGEDLIINVRVLDEPEVEIQQYEGIEAHYTKVILTENDVNERIEEMKKQFKVNTVDELLGQLGGVETVDDLKAELRESFGKLVDNNNNANIRYAVEKALVAANPIEVPEEVIEQQVSMQMDKIAAQMGESNFDNYVRNSGKTMDQIVDEVREEVQDEPKVNLLLGAVIREAGLTVNDEELREGVLSVANMGAQGQMGLFPGRKGLTYEEARAKLESNPGALEKVVYRIKLEKAMKYVIDHAVLVVDNEVSIMENEVVQAFGQQKR